MSISNETVSQVYACNGVTTTFAIPFTYKDTSTIKVYKKTVATGELVLLSYSSDYTYSPDPIFPTSIVTTSAFASTFNVVIIRESANTQTATYIDNGEFLAESHELALDKIVLQIQEADAKADRALKIPIGNSANTTFPILEAGKSLAVNDTADGFVMGPDASDLLAAASNAAAAAASASAAATSASNALTSANNAVVSEVNASISASIFQSGDRFGVLNLSLVSSVAANALTIAVKTKAGTDPSPSDPVTVEFISNGTYSRASITSALSLTISSGSTLGHSNGLKGLSGVYLIKNGSAIELAIGSTVPVYGTTISTTAEGGAGAADSGLTIYSQTARSNVPFATVGFFESTQTTAGTWASNVTLFLATHSTALVNIMKPTVQRFTSGSGTYTTPAGVKYITVEMVGGGGGAAGSGTASQTSGGVGGSTTFGSSLLTAGGGGGGAPWNIGAGGGGGAVTVNSPAIAIFSVTGSAGASGFANASSGVGSMAGNGGSSYFGGGGLGATGNAAGGAGASNSGSGGGGGGAGNTASAFSGGGGGSGAFIKALINNPASTYAYTVGTGGTAGTAGTSGYAGGVGAAGIIVVTEYYY